MEMENNFTLIYISNINIKHENIIVENEHFQNITIYKSKIS